LLVVNFADHLANASGYSQGDPLLVNVKILPQLVKLDLITERVDSIRRTVAKPMRDRAFT